MSDCLTWLEELVARTGVRRTALFLDVSADAQVTTEKHGELAGEVHSEVWG